MPKTYIWEKAILVQTFQGGGSSGHPSTDWNSSGGTTSVWVGIHTADPGQAASTASEGTYAAYARVLCDRSSVAVGPPAGWTITTAASSAAASAISPNANVSFPQITSAGSTLSVFGWMSIWPTSAALSSQCIYVGTITPNITGGQNVTPQLTTGTQITEQ
jgi:hypothetical protein